MVMGQLSVMHQRNDALSTNAANVHALRLSTWRAILAALTFMLGWRASAQACHWVVIDCFNLSTSSTLAAHLVG
jgi:hypothetical protein